MSNSVSMVNEMNRSVQSLTWKEQLTDNVIEKIDAASHFFKEHSENSIFETHKWLGFLGNPNASFVGSASKVRVETNQIPIGTIVKDSERDKYKRHDQDEDSQKDILATLDSASCISRSKLAFRRRWNEPPIFIGCHCFAPPFCASSRRGLVPAGR